jgi:lipopolysaccharide heptosyltransferase I
MYTAGTASSLGSHILVVRLGAMGDIIQTLPAVASLKHSFPGSHLTWLVESKWAPLLEGNPFVDRVAVLRRGGPSQVLGSCRDLRSARYDFAVDFQGLIKSALLASVARPDRIFGFHRSQVRERPAALFYSTQIPSASAHKVEQNLDLAAAAGAINLLRTFALPAGTPEGDLPDGDFVLASPLAGWRAKQWPLEFYRTLAARLRSELGIPLVLNGPPEAMEVLAKVPQALPMSSGIAGLIYATRRATAVVGVDSGPLHLAAGLGKPGVAIFGPTDPARNGPYRETFTVLRSPDATTTYKRGSSIDPSMWQVSPDDVFMALRHVRQASWPVIS